MIAIITDSTAYLTEKEALHYGVRIIPQRYTVGEKQYAESYAGSPCHGFSDGDEIDTREPETADFAAAFNDLSEKGYEILCITISSHLSGTYHNAAAAAESRRNVLVVDSQLTAGGLYLLVRRARRLASLNYSLAEIAENLEKYKQNISVLFSVEEMNTLRGSKRLGGIQRSADFVLNKKPILVLNRGKIEAEPSALSNSDLIRKIIRRIPAEARNILYHYAEATEKTEKLYSLIKRAFPAAAVEKRPLGPVLTAQLGSTIMGFVWE